MSDETSDKMRIADAIKLSIEQVEEMEKLTEEQYSEVYRQLSEMKKSWWLFPNYVWVAGIIAAGFCILYFTYWIIHVVGIMVMIYCVAQLCYRAGVSYGYVRGYHGGHEEGVHKALHNILGDDASEIFDRAFEDERE